MADDLKKTLENLPFGDAEWVGLRHVREETTERHVRDGKPQANTTWKTEGVMVEVLVNGQFGYAATPRLDPEGLRVAAQAARAQALRASSHAVFRFTAAQRPKVQARFATPVTRRLETLGAGELNGLLVKISERLQVSPKMVRTEAYARTVESETRFVSTNGSDAHQQFSLITTDFQATAQDGNIVQRRTDGGMRGRSLQGGWEHLFQEDLWERVDRVARQAIELIEGEECPTGPTSLLLMPDQMMLQIHESIGHPLEVDRILGDERNYAGWSFVKLEDFGKLQYGSPLLNATFDPDPGIEYASYAFDDTGTPARKEYLIRGGILERGLGGIESQARTGMPGVANQRASSWNRAPIDRMANLNLEPGSDSLEQMIASVEDGVLMESNRSWSIDDFRNKFQFGCEYARKIENGKLTRVLRNPNYRGVTVPFWRGLKRVGRADTLGTYGTPYCGKGEPNQAIRVGHASPPCLFEGVEVFGGGA